MRSRPSPVTPAEGGFWDSRYWGGVEAEGVVAGAVEAGGLTSGVVVAGAVAGAGMVFTGGAVGVVVAAGGGAVVTGVEGATVTEVRAGAEAAVSTPAVVALDARGRLTVREVVRCVTVGAAAMCVVVVT